MVASSSADIYSPFQPSMIPEEGHQSSEEGSGLHSPVFGAPYPTHGDSFRYQHDQLDIHHPPAPMIPPQYDYSQLEQPLELPTNSSARHATFSSHYPVPPRNHLGIDFPPQPPVNSRIPPSSHPVDFRYTERRLPGGSSHDHSYNRPSGNPSSLSIDADHRASLVSSSTAQPDNTPAPAATSTTPKEPRKEISSVVIACRQCRSRKIRCDSTRPQCNNCIRRSNECEYDAVPKRRGPDKRPGTRQRSCKKRPADGSAPPAPKRKRTTTTTERPPEQRELPVSRVKENLHDPKRPSSSSRQLDRHPQDPHYPHLQPHSGQTPPSPTELRISMDTSPQYKQDMQTPYRRTPYMYDQGSYTKSSYPRQLDVNTFQFSDHTHHRKFPAPTSPIIESQRIWWNKILLSHTLNDIAAELTFLVNNTGHLLSFVNLNFLIKRLFDANQRLQIQPSFILSVLAMARLMKSSTMEGGAHGLHSASVMVNDALVAFQEALEYRWVDATLAEAALILALFESSAHPDHTSGRATEALINLDSLIRNIQLTTIDTDERDVCRYSPNQVPTVGLGGDDSDRKCKCPIPEPTEASPHINRHYFLPWDPTWNESQIRDEEVRRLCWSALTLISDYVAQCQALGEDAYSPFFLTDPSNFVLLFPGEISDRSDLTYCSGPLSPKESVWALFCRSMLLWNFCNRFRQPSQDEERAEHAQDAFGEAQDIEDALNSHRCNLDTNLIYMTREYIHNTRMLVAQAFRSFQGIHDPRSKPGPIFKRRQAEDWFFYQAEVIRRVVEVIHTELHLAPGYQFTRRPFRINWFINQLAICLVLWNHDPTLDEALKLAKNILYPVDVLNALWPCAAIQQRCDSLRRQLVEACCSRGMEPPYPATYTVPAYLRINS